MECDHCGELNPERARFCMACGTPLAAPDASLDASAGDGAVTAATTPGQAAPPLLDPYIPAGLLSKLEAARTTGASFGERRIVTILFCDIQGSTAAAKGMDPEEWAEVMNGAFRHLIAPVYRYEGTLARLMGDGILAFFGAPIAHEDDPERAVLAGLEIVKGIADYRREVEQRWGFGVSVRVGINTGLVMVGEIGSDLRVEYTAMGDAVNLAARMEQTAAANSVQVTDAVQRLIAHRFETEPLGGIEVKGMGEAVQAYRVLKAKSEPGSLRGIEGLQAPLIGRSRELSALDAAALGLQQGRGHVAAVTGEAGVGKSRLMAELRQRVLAVDRPDGRLLWLEGRTLSYQRETPFAPFIDLFSRFLGLSSETDDERRWQRLCDSLAANAPGAQDDLAPFMAVLLGIPVPDRQADRIRFLQPAEMRAYIFGAVHRFIQTLASRQPLLLVLEDLHWSDDISLELLAELMPLTQHAPVMIVGVFRPAQGVAQTRRFDQQAQAVAGAGYLKVQLQPLAEDESRQLIASLLEIEGLPEEVRGRILARTQGNPFFMEEVIRALIDDGVIVREGDHWRATDGAASVTIPHTLAAVLTARLDRLAEPVRQVAQVASVIGREFYVDLVAALDGVAAVLEPALRELQVRDLVVETARTPRRMCQFKHVLTQEAAYHSLLRRRRRQLHSRLADLLITNDPQRVGEIAHHFWEAGERRKALPFLIEAGDQAAGRFATGEAIGWYRRGLEVVQDETAAAALVRRLYEGYGSVQTMAGDIEGAVATYRTMEAYALEHGDVPMQISALNKLALVGGIMQQDFEAAERALQKAEALASQHRDMDGLSEASVIRCTMGALTAESAKVVEHLDELAQLNRRLNETGQLAMTLEHMAEHQIFLTRYDEAWETAQEAVAAARAAGDLLHESGAHVVMSEIHLRNGDLEAAHAAASKALALAKTVGSAEALAVSSNRLGQLSLLQGDLQAALDHYQEALADSRMATALWVQPMALAGLGTVHLRIGGENLEQARAYHAEAELVTNSLFGSVTGTFACAEMGFCALKDGELDRADALIEKGLNLEGALMRIMRPHLLVGAAMVAVGRGDYERAAVQLQRARRQVGEAGMRHVEPMLQLAEARWAEAQGDAEEALRQFQAAEQTARAMGMRPTLWESLRGSARMLAALGREDDARMRQEAAEAVLVEMAGLFRDEALRERFLQTQRQADL